MRFPLCFITLTAFFTLSSVAFAQQAAGPPAPTPALQSRVEAHATFDEQYLYFAFQIDDSNLLGTNTKPMSAPTEDDAIGVYFHMGKDRPDYPTPSTHAMIVSAAGGFTFLTGDAEKKALIPRPLFSIKYGINLQGTLNRADDRDKGFTVTMAIPLDALGLDPKTLTPGTELAVNIISYSRTHPFASYSPNVGKEDEIARPSRWTKLVFLGEDAGNTDRYKGALPLPPLPVKGKPPLIDGVYRPAEWPAVGGFRFNAADIPEKQLVVEPTRFEGAEADSVAPDLSLTALKTGMERRVFARYLMRYQADLRKRANPFRGIFGPDGSLLLRHQPATGIGPWFSVDRVAWHRDEMLAMKRAGIDVALVEMAGPEGDSGLLDEKALLVLIAALREMAAASAPAPQLALCLDLRQIVPGQGKKADLATPDGRGALYEGIRRWFKLVPPEFRFRVNLPPDENGTPFTAYPVVITNGDGVLNADNPEWPDFLRRRFAADFGMAAGGTTLLVAGGEGVGSKNIAASLPLLTGGSGNGFLPTYVVQPGNATPASFVPRRDGQTYRDSWMAAATANPAWIIVDSWNDWFRGTEVAASRQYGLRYQEMTRALTIQATGLPVRSVHWVSHDVPRRLRPGQLVTVAVTFRNASAEILKAGAGIGVTYRWKQGNTVVAESPLLLPISGALLPTQTARVPVGVLAARPLPEGTLEPLAPGNYTLEIDLAERSGEGRVFWSDSAGTTQPLRVPVTVLDVPDAVEFAAPTTPTLLMANTAYPVQIAVRWLGSEPVTPEDVSLVYQLLSEDGKRTLFSGTAPLLKTLQPGQWETLPAILRLGDAGAPVPPACPETRKNPLDNEGGYRLRWLLSRRQSTEAVPGEYVEQVAVYPAAQQARVIPVVPDSLEMNANALTETEVWITNPTLETWAKGSLQIGYHWFQPDGLEQQWKPPLLVPLHKDVKPGDKIRIKVPVRAPDREGEYILAYDVLQPPDTFLSTQMISRPNDLGVVPVHVTGGRLTFVDLKKRFDVDGVASENNRQDGDLDGAGNTFPAESFPPDSYGIAAYFNDARKPPVYPSGYFADVSLSARGIAFRYGSEKDGAKNAVTCNGQTISVPKGRYVAAHLAALAVGGKDTPLELTLRYKDGSTSPYQVTVGDWNRPASPTEPVAVRTDYQRGSGGDRPVLCVLRHLIVPVDVSRELAAIELPKQPTARIFALTLEK